MYGIICMYNFTCTDIMLHSKLSWVLCYLFVIVCIRLHVLVHV